MALDITILSDMPKFAGNPRAGERSFVPEIDPRTFLRSIENYFMQHNITNNDKKLSILFSLIDKSKGDALNFINCYIGKKIPFNEIRTDFLNMYPSFKFTDFKHAAQALLATKLIKQDMFVSMTNLEMSSGAAAEAYVNNEALTKGRFDAKSLIPNSIPPPGSPASDASDDDGAPQIDPLFLIDVIQNYTIHLFAATQADNKIYEQIANCGPELSSTRIMGKVVRATKKHKISCQKKPENTNEIAFQARQVTGPQTDQKSVARQTFNTTTDQSYNKAVVTCFRCKQPGHVKRECPACAFCLKTGHRAKDCRTRLAQAKGKYCRNCQIKDSHSTNECFSKNARPKQQQYRTTQANVHVAQSDDVDDSWDPTNADDEDWDPNSEDQGEAGVAEPEQY